MIRISWLPCELWNTAASPPLPQTLTYHLFADTRSWFGVANTFDVAVEWYFRPGSLLSAAFFYKDIKSFIQNVNSQIPFNQLGLPNALLENSNTLPDELFTVSQPFNTPGGKLKGYILDLRNNPGGLLDQAIALSDAFLDKGEIVSVKARKNEDVQRWNAKAGDVANGLPIVVLMNGGSASASEIVAGALQDHKRAIILGTRSFGKGSVQTIMQVAGGGALRLTTALYFTPSGRSIQKEGIKPDIEVEQAKVETIQQRMSFREENLRRSITNPNDKPGDKKDEAKPEAAKPGDKEKPAAAQPGTDPDEPPKEAVADYQLMRALDLIRGISLYSSRAN